MKSRTCIMILALLLGCCLHSHAQKVTVLKSLVNYEGKLGDWGKKTGNKVVPTEGYVFYAIGDAVWVVLSQEKPTPMALERFVKANEALQKKLFGETYDSYTAKAQKKKKGKKKGIVRKCANRPNCSGQCYALFNNGEFLRCGGACCGAGFEDDLFPGTAETWETSSGR